MTAKELEEEKARLLKGAAERMFEITDILASVPSGKSSVVCFFCVIRKLTRVFHRVIALV